MYWQVRSHHQSPLELVFKYIFITEPARVAKYILQPKTNEVVGGINLPLLFQLTQAVYWSALSPLCKELFHVLLLFPLYIT
jgi:hypothetical protein